MKDYTIILKDISRIELSSLLDYLRANKLDFSVKPNDGKPIVSRSAPKTGLCSCGALLDKNGECTGRY